MYHTSDTGGVVSEDEVQVPFHPFKTLNTSQLIQNLLKNQTHSLLRFISVVNRKSNFMIRLNALMLFLLTIYVTFLSSSSFTDKAIVFFLALSCVFSLVYAVLAACPIQSLCKVASVRNEEDLFAHFFIQQIPQDEYLNAFAEVAHDQDLLYKQMSVEFFMLSRILFVKNKRLRLSYKSFLMGILFTGGFVLFLSMLTLS
jgi:hypothetical protein